jgi:DNA-binding XRE family transcriptional regulator
MVSKLNKVREELRNLLRLLEGKQSRSPLNYARRGKKLTHAQVVRIYHGHKNMSQVEIAKKYGVSCTLISNIRKGKTWPKLTQN